MTPDVIIIGGGIVGAACALECSRANMRVTILEPGYIGGGATAAAMGHVVVMNESEAQFALTKLSRDLWRDFSKNFSKDFGKDAPVGTLWIAADEEEMSAVHSKHRFFTTHGVRAELLDQRQLREAEPNLSHRLAGALLVTDDMVVNPPEVALHMVTNSFAKIIQAHAVKIEPHRVTLQNGDVIEAKIIFNAAGIYAAQLMLKLPIPITPRKGHLLLTERYPGFAHHQLVELGYLKSAHEITTESSVAFNVQPQTNGQLLIGSSRQFGANYPEIDAPVMRDMVERAEAYMPGISRLATTRSWTGFRGATPDKLPLIGPCPGVADAYIAAGHEGLGITTSLGTARILVDHILGRTPPIPIEPYFPDRNHA